MEDLEERVNQFHMLQLPGQPMAMHMGTSHLIDDLWKEIKKLRMPEEPTIEILKVLCVEEPEDWIAGKEAQTREIDVPPNHEMEVAYGKYQRLVKLLKEES